EQAAETFRTAMAQGINYIDTAPLYGLGSSEERLGRVLPEFDRSHIVISTKIGRTLCNRKRFGGGSSVELIYDYTRDGVRESLEGSLERMGVDFVNILFIHGPDSHYGPAIENAYPALAELRDDGVVKAIGAGMNQWEMELKFAQEGEFDCFLLANRYTLLEQGAITEFLPYCKKNDISVIIGGPYNSGVLANPGEGRYEYRAAPSEIVDRTLRLKGICEKYGVPLRAAALQFVLAHPAVASVIPGTKSPEHQEDNFRMIDHPIPADLWGELREEQLIRPEAPTPR
ncbi:MAG: aldo/keto reductase, partial [Candidatus Bathyarchaeota archaeon]|nr:aldo/keto reductase [Candidatus Bathyarchaeota archaeon]